MGREQSQCRDRVLQLLLRQPVETTLPSLDLRPEITVELHGQATAALPMRRDSAPMHYVKSPPLRKTQSAFSSYCHGVRQQTQHEAAFVTFSVDNDHVFVPTVSTAREEQRVGKRMVKSVPIMDEHERTG